MTWRVCGGRKGQMLLPFSPISIHFHFKRRATSPFTSSPSSPARCRISRTCPETKREVLGGVTQILSRSSPFPPRPSVLQSQSACLPNTNVPVNPRLRPTVRPSLRAPPVQFCLSSHSFLPPSSTLEFEAVAFTFQFRRRRNLPEEYQFRAK